MGALYVKQLAEKTHRGLRGRVEAGRSGGGNSYGYEVVRKARADGEVEVGIRAINPQEAEVVRRIYRAYAHGEAPRSIAKALNREGVPGPSGGTWGPSTINGNASRGTGILNNELYVGKLVWNRLKYVKNPNTGKRQSRLNPPEAWIIKDVPELRIVPQELWDAVKARQAQMARATRPDRKKADFWKHQRPRYLLSGLMKCGACGASYTKYGANRFACAGARDRATCSNHLTIRGDDVEHAILAWPQDPADGAVAVRGVCAGVHGGGQQATLCGIGSKGRHAVRHRAHRPANQAPRRRDPRGRRCQADQCQAQGAGGREGTIDGARAQRCARGQAASCTPTSRRSIAPEFENLEAALRDPDHGREAFEIVRGLIEEVRIVPADGELAIELRGELAGIMALAETAQTALWLNIRTGHCKLRWLRGPASTET